MVSFGLSEQNVGNLLSLTTCALFFKMSINIEIDAGNQYITKYLLREGALRLRDASDRVMEAIPKCVKNAGYARYRFRE